MNRRLSNDIINALTEQNHEQLNVSRQILLDLVEQRVTLSEQNMDLINISREILASESRAYKETTEQQNSTNEGLQTLTHRFGQMEQQQEDRSSCIMDELSKQNHKLSNASQVLASLERESYDCRERTAQLNRSDDEILQTLDNMSRIQRRQEELCNTSNGLLLNISHELAETRVVTERRDQMSFEIFSGVATARREQLNSSEQILQSLGQMQQSQQELSSTSDQLVQSSFRDMNASMSEQKRELNNVSHVLLRIETTSQVTKEASKETSERLNSTYEVLHRMEQRQEQLGDKLIELRREHLNTTSQVLQILEQQHEDLGSGIMDELSKQNHKLSNASEVLASLERESYGCRDGLLLNISLDLAEAYVVTERRDQMSFDILSGVASARREQLNSSEQIIQSLGQMQQSQRELSSTSDQLIQSSFLDMNASSVQLQQRQEEINDNIMSEFSKQKRELNNISQNLLRIESAQKISKETEEQQNSTYEVLLTLENRMHRMEQRQEQLRNEHLNTTSQVLQVLGQLFSMISARNPKGCYEIKEKGFYESGIYDIFPASSGGFFQVYCDMQTAGGGWTVNMSFLL